MATLSELIAFLEARLALPGWAAKKEVPLVWRPAATRSDVMLRSVGLALEFSPHWEQEAEACDVLFLHRPFSFPVNALPGVPILASHSGFDTHLTTGYNPALAAALDLRNITPLFRADRSEEILPTGMIGDVDPPQQLGIWSENAAREFQGLDVSLLQDTDTIVRRAAVMNALNPALIALAHEGEATVYVTGQMRDSAYRSVWRTGISLLAAGHYRTEWWGLRCLGVEIKRAFPELTIQLLHE